MAAAAGPARPAYRRIVLKLSGEALAGALGYGIDPDVLVRIAEEIRGVADLHVQTAVVIGGGNIFRGIAASTFRIMSGYRTPYYNRRVGNETSYSRHVYGDAADIYVDEDGDGRMDDLDRDGRVTLGDARVLARVVESMSDRWGDDRFEGGLGFYGATRSHGPFVHVDTRGWRARWGPQAGTARH